MLGGWHGNTRSQVCAGSVMNRYRWARFVMLIAETTISGERYKAGKEKPLNGALFNYNPRHSLNFQILVLRRQACHLYQCRLRLVEPFWRGMPVVDLPHA